MLSCIFPPAPCGHSPRKPSAAVGGGPTPIAGGLEQPQVGCAPRHWSCLPSHILHHRCRPQIGRRLRRKGTEGKVFPSCGHTKLQKQAAEYSRQAQRGNAVLLVVALQQGFFSSAQELFDSIPASRWRGISPSTHTM